MNRISEILKTLVRYGDRGGGAYHAISNQIWLWNIALTLALIPQIVILFVLYGELLGTRRWDYLISYLSVPVGVAAIQSVLFWWGNSAGVGRRTLALHLLIFSDCAMIWLFSLLIGAAGGIHFIFPAALALPFYFFRREVQARAWVIKGVWVGAIVGQFVLVLFFSPAVMPWRPLPSKVTDLSGTIIVVILVLNTITYCGYFWWQWGMTGRLVAYWNRLSLIGITEELTGQQRKYEILINRAALFGLLYFGVLSPGLLLGIGLIELYKGNTQILWQGLYYGPAYGGISLILAVVVRLRYKKNAYLTSLNRNNLLEVSFYVAANILWFSNGIMIQKESMLYLFPFTSIVYLPIIRRRSSMHGVMLFSLVAVALLDAGGILLWHAHYPPIMPAPTWSVPFLTVILFIMASASMFFPAYYLRHESDKAESALEVAHAESEKLLLNILPAEVSHELKAHGHTTPREYPSATVLFTDFVGFTRIAEKLTAVDLVRELDQCFSYFDNVAQKYGLEKLKTIGDAYMAAGGIPVENNTHPFDCAMAALEIQAFMNQMKEIKEQQGLPYWELRLGMHTGPLVAGVVGEKKFAYDVWGDTVNTASRMESSGQPGVINISRELYDQLRFLFVCEYRGKVNAKNKGKIEMYFLRSLKPKFSIQGEGRVPNEVFKVIYEKVKAGARLVKKQSHENRETA